MNPLPCIVCSKALEPIAETLSQPSGGVIFTSYGNYGGCYDPMDQFILGGDPANKHIEITICDDCLLAAAAKQQVYHVATPVVAQPQPEKNFWDPLEE